MKGCLSTIIVILTLTFAGLYGYQKYSEGTISILDYFNIDSETLDDLLEITSIDLDSILKFFDSKKETVYVEPITFKPTLNAENTRCPSQPKTVEDFKKVFLYMANQNLLEISFNYSESYKTNFEDSRDIQSNCSTAFDSIVVEYVDLFSGVGKADYKMSGNSLSSSLTIKLSSQYVSDEELQMQQVYFERTAFNINQELHETNYITKDMTQKEIAEVLFTYVTSILSYDVDIDFESYTGYGAVKNNTAVCQGYTALYNYLLKLNDIYCIGQSGYVLSDGSPHIWTVALLDGVVSYSDVTFGDPTPDVANFTDYDYFDADKTFLSTSRSGVE